MKAHCLNLAGLVREDAKTLFVREDMFNMWAFLEESHRTFLVQGPPGTGKSSGTWVWASKKALTGSTVLWAHLRFGQATTVALLKGDKITAIGSMTDAKLQKLIQSPAHSATIIVLDGVVGATSPELRQEASVWASNHDGHLVQVTSEGAGSTKGETLIETEMGEHTVFSWSKEQYEAALEGTTFCAEVEANLGDGGDTIKEKMEAKFYFAGVSARWMFGFSVLQMKIDITKWMEKSWDLESMVKGLSGAASLTAVNHLLQRVPVAGHINGVCFPVSEYVANLIAAKVGKAFVMAAKTQAVLLGDGGLDGIVLELDFKVQLRGALQEKKPFVVKISDVNEEKWEVSHILSVDGLNTVEDEAITHGVWFDPIVGQGGYDMTQVTVPDSALPTKIFVRFVQVTRGKKHDLKLKFMLAFIAALTARGFVMVGVDVVILVPAGNCGAFKLGTVYSDKTFSQACGTTWAKADVRVAGMDRS